MEKIRKEALQVTKELVVKFIEAGRVSPSNLGEVFSQTYGVVLETISRDFSITVSDSGAEADHLVYPNDKN